MHVRRRTPHASQPHSQTSTLPWASQGESAQIVSADYAWQRPMHGNRLPLSSAGCLRKAAMADPTGESRDINRLELEQKERWTFACGGAETGCASLPQTPSLSSATVSRPRRTPVQETAPSGRRCRIGILLSPADARVCSHCTSALDSQGHVRADAVGGKSTGSCTRHQGCRRFGRRARGVGGFLVAGRLRPCTDSGCRGRTSTGVWNWDVRRWTSAMAARPCMRGRTRRGLKQTSGSSRAAWAAAGSPNILSRCVARLWPGTAALRTHAVRLRVLVN